MHNRNMNLLFFFNPLVMSLGFPFFLFVRSLLPMFHICLLFRVPTFFSIVMFECSILSQTNFLHFIQKIEMFIVYFILHYEIFHTFHHSIPCHRMVYVCIGWEWFFVWRWFQWCFNLCYCKIVICVMIDDEKVLKCRRFFSLSFALPFATELVCLLWGPWLDMTSTHSKLWAKHFD